MRLPTERPADMNPLLGGLGWRALTRTQYPPGEHQRTIRLRRQWSGDRDVVTVRRRPGVEVPTCEASVPSVSVASGNRTSRPCQGGGFQTPALMLTMHGLPLCEKYRFTVIDRVEPRPSCLSRHLAADDAGDEQTVQRLLDDQRTADHVDPLVAGGGRGCFDQDLPARGTS